MSRLANKVHDLVTQLQLSLLDVRDCIATGELEAIDHKMLQDALQAVKSMAVHKEIRDVEKRALLLEAVAKASRKVWNSVKPDFPSWRVEQSAMLELRDAGYALDDATRGKHG